jgi:hypothetical protein
MYTQIWKWQHFNETVMKDYLFFNYGVYCHCMLADLIKFCREKRSAKYEANDAQRFKAPRKEECRVVDEKLLELGPRIMINTMGQCTHEDAIPPDMEYADFLPCLGTPAKEYPRKLPFQWHTRHISKRLLFTS